VELGAEESEEAMDMDRPGVIPAERHKAITKHAQESNRIDRFNTRLQQRVSRLVHETLSVSKKLAHHIDAIKYFICHHNLTRTTALPV
jgi:insertion element IS1 protein InsB